MTMNGKETENSKEKTPARLEAGGVSRIVNQSKPKKEDDNMDSTPNRKRKQTRSTEGTKGNKNQSESSGLLDLSRLRMTQDFCALAGVKKKITFVPVRKPHRQEFVRVHPEDGYAFQAAILELKDDSEIFIVDPTLWSELDGEIVPKILLTTINRQGVLTLWPIKLPDPDGRIDNWNHTAMKAASIAKKEWVRVAANRSLGGYEASYPTGDLPDPDWPELSFQEIMDIAFRDRYIRDIDHPAIRRLLGQI